MAVKKRGLGRGLDALLGRSKAEAALSEGAPVQEADSAISPQPVVTTAETTAQPQNNQPSEGSLRHLPIEFIQPGKYQPRIDMRTESLEDLAQSIRVQGVMQPIVVRSLTSTKYEIIAGERRWRACQLAGLDRIPVIIKEVDDSSAIAMALIENIQRENLNPVEEAMALKRLQDEFELTQQEVADAVGRSRAAVANLLRLMSLQHEVRTFLEHGDLEMGHARALLSLAPEQQVNAARTVIGKSLSVRQTEALVRKMQEDKKPETNSSQPDADILSLQDQLSEKLGTEVLVEHNAKGKGRIIFKYSSLDQLDGILAHIN